MSEPAPPPATPRRRRHALVAVGVLCLVGVSLGSLAGFLLSRPFAASYPSLTGNYTLPGVSAELLVLRDDRAIPTIRAANRLDASRALGFLHGRERFFQMDLQRRHAAGELSALVGVAALDEDTRNRVHRFRARADRAVASLSPDDVATLAAYAEGVEAGRASLAGPPWEYSLLGTTPEAWTPADTCLVVYAMYMMLQQSNIDDEIGRVVAAEALPPALWRFLSPAGTPFDAPLIGGPLPSEPIPDAKDIDLRRNPDDWKPPAQVGPPSRSRPRLGSNNWAVAGSRSTHGGAIVANDMHLGLRVPNIWYRARLEWKDATGRERSVTGATLPGAPVVVAGATDKLAWGFTNSEGDYADLRVVELVNEGRAYKTPHGPRDFVRHEEVIRVKGGPPKTLTVTETIYGPLYDVDHKKRPRALSWSAHLDGAVDLTLMRLETAATVDDAVAIAPACGTPAQNVVFADAAGDIAWTILGTIPARKDGAFAGRLPAGDYPRLVRPADGLLWTANNRVVGDPALSLVGRGHYDHGARAMQIRDALRSRQKLSESDMLDIQLDDRALFLRRWQQLLVQLLDPASPDMTDARRAIRAEVVSWGERASIDSVGFRVVRGFHNQVTEKILRSLTAPAQRLDPRFNHTRLDASCEESVYRLASKRPAHLLPPGHDDWRAFLLSSLDVVQKAVARDEADVPARLPSFTWGELNTARIRHPLSGAVGPLAGVLRLDMPAEPLPGANRGMPRVQTPSDGASQRMAVSPGRPGEGYFHMPTGQIGHPWSPHYRDMHADWARGRASAFLPAEPAGVMRLRR